MKLGFPPTAVAVGLVASLVMSGCGSGNASSSSSTAAAAANASTTTVTTTSTQTTTAATTSAPPTPNAVGTPTCPTSELRLSPGSAGGAAGTAYIYYELTNVGPAACSMIGYPGVAVLDSRGHIVQHAASRGAAIAVPVRTLTLRSGQRAKFLVNSTDVIPSPGCPHPYTGRVLQVYPPNQRAAIVQPYSGSFCNLRVGPVQPAG